MSLLNSVSYSNPMYSDGGSLVGVDLHHEERVVRLLLCGSDESDKSVNYSEEEQVAQVIDNLLNYGVEYKEAVEVRDVMLDGYRWLGEHTSDEDNKAFSLEVAKYKPVYDTLVQLLGSVDSADKAIQHYTD